MSLRAHVEDLDPGNSVAVRSRLQDFWEDLKAPFLVFLGLRVFLSVAVYLVSPFLPFSYRGVPWSALPDQPLLDVWVRWDSGWYASIVEAGYRYSLEQASNVAFLPAYPLAIKAFTLLTGNTWTAGILVSNLAFLAALIVLFKLTQLKFGRAVAGRAVLYTGAFPAAFFYFSMYSESLYLLAVLFSFYFWEKRRDWSGGIAGAVAAFTRPLGMTLLLAGAAFHLVERGRRVGEGHTAPLIVRYGVRSRLSWSVLSLLFIPLALAGFMAYTYAVFGEPLAFLKSRTVGWAEPVSLLPTSHVELVASILNGGIFRGQGPALRLLDGASAVAFLALTGTVFKRLGPSYGLYSLGSLAMALVVNLDGLTRYVAVIFPVFMALASWRQRAVVAVPLVILSLMLMGLMASMFAKWHFVG